MGWAFQDKQKQVGLIINRLLLIAVEALQVNWCMSKKREKFNDSHIGQ